ncbi:MAG: hypothetical protein KF729_35260 [Sandaracinaceae bacterium]|nr:hypothetical protein [Sandaracinaceae bacterium]
MLALAGVWGCDGNTGTDAGPGGSDAGPGGSDAGMMMRAAVGSGPSRAELTAADYACRGMRTAPSDSGDLVTFTGEVRHFQSRSPVEGLTVHFFPDNAVTPDCTGSCVALTTNAAGNIEVMDNTGSWYAYRIVAGNGSIAGAPDSYIETVHFNAVAPAAAGAGTFNAVTGSLRDTILTLLGLQADEGTATITGALSDCGGATIANATIRVFGDDGEVVLANRGARGPRQFYFGSSGLPVASETSTNTNGLYGAANVPVPASGRVRVELWGALTDGGEAELLGCENVNVTPDGISILSVTPQRSDGPSCSM